MLPLPPLVLRHKHLYLLVVRAAAGFVFVGQMMDIRCSFCLYILVIVVVVQPGQPSRGPAENIARANHGHSEAGIVELLWGWWSRVLVEFSIKTSLHLPHPFFCLCVFGCFSIVKVHVSLANATETSATITSQISRRARLRPANHDAMPYYGLFWLW